MTSPSRHRLLLHRLREPHSRESRHVLEHLRLQLAQCLAAHPHPEQPWNNSQYGLDAVNYYDVYGATSIGAGSGGASSSAVCAARL